MGTRGKIMKVCVQGLWHLGTVTAACLASLGNEVKGLDFDADTIAGLNKGIPPLLEPGLEELLKEQLAAKRLEFCVNPAKACQDADFLWVAYDTPVDDDDNADVDYVVTQIQQALPHLPVGATVLVSSQMPVGSIARLEGLAGRQCPEKNLGFAYSPENLRLGKALDVFLKPDRIIVGTRVARDRERLEPLLRSISDHIEWMSVESAEMTKHAINAFLATSVTFANEVATICSAVGADAKEVERGLKTESRIGPKAYLSPGGAFAGGTLARDVAFLNDIGANRQLTTPLLSSIKASNSEHKHWARRRLQSLLPDLSHACVAVWGLTYKPGTDTLRRSMAVELCEWLIEQDATIQVHDPAVKDLPRQWQRRVSRKADELSALKGAQALVISTEWPQYKSISGQAIATAAPNIAVLDANRFLVHLASGNGLRYKVVLQ